MYDSLPTQRSRFRWGVLFLGAVIVCASGDERGIWNAAADELGSQTGAGESLRKKLALDSLTPASPSNASCDPQRQRACEELVQDNILWRIDEPDSSAAKHWQQKNLTDLCVCTSDPYATVNCSQIEVNNHRKSWRQAIATCRATP